MKKFYDKLFLAIAVLVLLGGAAFYVLKSGDAADQGTGAASPPKGEAYQAIQIPDPVANDASWPEPEPQSSGPKWLYDVFTPPQIFIDKEGNYTVIPPKSSKPAEPFGLYLAEITHKPYRIQIQGFSGDRSKPEECVLFFFDEERQIRFFIRPGQENAEAEVEVLDFIIDREIDANNVVKVTAVATIEDKRSGKTIKLVDGQRLFDEEVAVVFRSKEDADVLVEFSIDKLPEEGVSFKTTLGQYVLKEISLEDQTATVEKEATEESEARTLTLTALPTNLPEKPQPGIESSGTSSDEPEFDFVF